MIKDKLQHGAVTNLRLTTMIMAVMISVPPTEAITEPNSSSALKRFPDVGCDEA